jgi:xylulokinase
MNVLAIDLGSTGVKVAVVDDLGTVLGAAGEVLTMIVTGDGGVEQDPHEWWEAIGRCARRALDGSTVSGSDVSLVAVTSQYTSTVAVADDGRPLANAIMWMDGRGRRFNPAIADATTRPRWLELHGMAPFGNDDIGHVGIIRHLWPEVYAAATAFVEPMDYVAARLTGRVTATQNTMFPMMSVDNRTWGSTTYSDELLAMSMLDADKLPPLVPLGEPRGSVTAEAAAHLGVSPRALVMGATLDSVTSSIGTGAIDASRCGLIIGTTSVMATHVDSKRHDPAHGLTSAPSPVPDNWFLVAENGIGGKALEVFVDNVVYPDDDLGAARPHDAFERVLAAAATVPPGANGVMFLPWLIGSMAPGFKSRNRGGFVNLGLNSSRRDMARAVLEGVAMNAAWLLEHVATLAGHQYAEIALGGGGAASPLWGQILADCCGTPVRRLANSASTNAHGAALLALVEAGQLRLHDVPSILRVAQIHEPDPGVSAVLRARLAAFIDFHDRAAPFYEALNSTRGGG